MAGANGGRVVLALVLSVIGSSAVSGCLGDPYSLPDRSDPAVQAAEAELAALLSRDGWTCEVRVLGEEDEARFAWSECSGAPMSLTLRLDDGERQVVDSAPGSSGPVRVEGGRVEGPGDGSAYEPDVRRLFPGGLADRILRDSGSLRP